MNLLDSSTIHQQRSYILPLCWCSKPASIYVFQISSPLYSHSANIVSDSLSFSRQRFADLATSLGTTLFAFIKAQVLQTRRARDGNWSDTSSHRHSSNADSASAVIAAQIAGGGSSSGSGGGGSGGENDDSGRAGTSATPQAWAKLSSLSYRRERTNEILPFPAGLVGLLKAITDVLDHCVGTGDLAVRRGWGTRKRGWMFPTLQRSRVVPLPVFEL